VTDRDAALTHYVDRIGLHEVGTADPEAAGDGLPQNNMQSLDRSRSGRRGASDRRVTAQDRALRERNSRSFDQRWGSLTGNVGINWPTR
jgi:hypothetical protein